MIKNLILLFICHQNPSFSFYIENDSYESWVSKYHHDDLDFHPENNVTSIFDDNVKFINDYNSHHDDFEIGLNPFSYLTTQEFVSHYCGTVLPKKPHKVFPTATPAPLNKYTLDNLPESISWKRFASPVRDQGKICGSCYAFSTTALIEIHNRIRRSRWSSILAPQYIVDCSHKSKKCRGGWPTYSLEYLKGKSKNQAPEESVYPYTAKGDDHCYDKVPKINLNIPNIFEYELEGDERQLRFLIANHGPLIITMNVSDKSKLFQLYRRGVFYEPECVNSDMHCETINHSMLVVGYGVTKRRKRPYFLVQNSWGKKWGEDGYIKMSMNRGNNCNIACFAIYIG